MIGRKFVDEYLNLSRMKNSILCVGIDPVSADMRSQFNIPMKFFKDRGAGEGVREFSLNIIESVTPFAPIIKPNAQFIVYLLGFDGLKEIVKKIHDGNSLALLDIKLSDIGTTIEAGLYWIDKLGFDAVTFSPFPGYQNGVDSVYKWGDENEKGIFALCRMSNPGTHDYQSRLMEGEKFYKKIARDAFEHGCNGFVVGCTATEELKEVREIIGNDPLILSPGLGPQGGDPKIALKFGANQDGEGLIISSSRGINYAYEVLGWSFERYAEAAGLMAERKRDELNSYRSYGVG
jgi:orotidine-5'-phosphate decarboxylase